MPSHTDPDFPAGYDGHRRAQLKEWAQMQFPEKLKWLDEAHLFALAMHQSGKRQANDPPAQQPGASLP